MKRVIPAGRIAIVTWMAVAVVVTVAMTVCSSCGAQASAQPHCVPAGRS